MYKGTLFILCGILTWCTWSCTSVSSEQISTDKQPKARALLATKYVGLEDFQNVVKIEYLEEAKDSAIGTVKLSYLDNNELITGKLSDGITQGDLTKALRGNQWDKLYLAMRTPYAVWNRKKLSEVFMLARHFNSYFGEGDVAFYDIAQASMRNISPQNGAFDNFRDSLEKGYINTFNHVTAQTFITALYDEEIADYVATVHERHTMPHLVSGLFSEKQLNDTFDFPVDNYVDIINNEIGQELGKWLRCKYKITADTEWNASFTCQFMNDIQDYYARSFQIKIKPFMEQHNVVVHFSAKIEGIKKGISYL